MKARTEKKRVPIERGLFTLPATPTEKPHLIGSKCGSCGEVLFPKQVICANCFKEDTEEIALSTRGKVYSSTLMRYPIPLYKGPVPSAVGHVELPEGVIIAAPFTECDLAKPLKIGTEVEMVIEGFGEDEEGNEIVSYKFKPV